MLEIAPDPLPQGFTAVEQTWTIAESGGVGFDVTAIAILTFASDSTLQGSPEVFSEEDVRTLWASLFIPADQAIAGTRTSDVPALPGGWWLVLLDAVDDNDNVVAETLRVNIQ